MLGPPKLAFLLLLWWLSRFSYVLPGVSGIAWTCPHDKARSGNTQGVLAKVKGLAKAGGRKVGPAKVEGALLGYSARRRCRPRPGKRMKHQGQHCNLSQPPRPKYLSPDAPTWLRIPAGNMIPVQPNGACTGLVGSVGCLCVLLSSSRESAICQTKSF